MTLARGMTIEDFTRLRWAMEPAMHPSESAVAYVVSGPNAELDALGHDLVVSDRQTTVIASGARTPRWSPDGGRIAFLRRSGSRWVPACRTVGGSELDLPVPPGDATDIDWAPDGDRLLVLTTGPSPMLGGEAPYRVHSSRDWAPPPPRRAWIVAPGLSPILLGAGVSDVVAARWSPDGSRIALISDQDVDRDTSTALGIWSHVVGAGTSCLVPPTTPIRTLAWSPDGSRIAYIALARNNAASALGDLWVLDVETLARQRLAVGLDRSVGLPVRGDDERGIGPPALAWAPDSRSVLAIYADGGTSRLGRFDLGGGWEDVVAGERAVLEFSQGAAGVAYSWSDSVTPGEVSVVGLDGGSDRQVSDVGRNLDVAFAAVSRFSATSADGVKIDGWLAVPPDRPSAPLVLQVHGGPHYPVGERFSFDTQRLVARGLAVLRANPRGSQGYGQEFADGNLGDWGGRDLDDLLAVVDEAVRLGGLDASRVAIIGESYGGYMAGWAVANSERFAAAVVENGIADFLSAAAGSIGPTFWHSELGGPPWENLSAYVDRSVIARIEGITVPVLVIHCEADTTCPVSHGEAIYAALRGLGRDVEFLRVPGEGHFFNVFGACKRRLERTAVLDEFLVRHLLDSDGDGEEIAS